MAQFRRSQPENQRAITPAKVMRRANDRVSPTLENRNDISLLPASDLDADDAGRAHKFRRPAGDRPIGVEPVFAAQ
jgi:hypothetical protein